MQITKSVGRLKIVIRMIDINYVVGYLPQIVKVISVGTPVSLLLVLGKQWIKSSNEAKVRIKESDNRLKEREVRYKETKLKCKTKVEVARIRAGISQTPKPNNSNLRIDKDSS